MKLREMKGVPRACSEPNRDMSVLVPWHGVDLVLPLVLVDGGFKWGGYCLELSNGWLQE